MLTCTVSLIFLAFVGLFRETSQAFRYRDYETDRGEFKISTDELEPFGIDVKELFTQYDKNKDGVLGQHEFFDIIIRLKFPEFIDYTSKNPSRSISAFIAAYREALDDDRDGKLTMKDLERIPVKEKEVHVPACDYNYEIEKNYEGSGDY